MTTILGIKAEGGIVLAADSQLNVEGDDGKVKMTLQKILNFNDAHCLAFTGTVNRYVERYFSDMEKGQLDGFYRFLLRDRAIPLNEGLLMLIARQALVKPRQSSIRKPKKSDKATLARIMGRESRQTDSLLEQYTMFNYKLLKGSQEMVPLQRAIEGSLSTGVVVLNIASAHKFDANPSEEGIELIVARSKPDPQLYSVGVLGNVKPVTAAEGIEYISKGSGSEHVVDYIDNERYRNDKELRDVTISTGRLSLGAAMDLAIRAVEFAIEKDESSGDLVEYAVITEQGVDNYATMQRTEIQDAKTKVREEAKQKYSHFDTSDED
jgi:20S proteasome alpha/beta subunit